MAEENTPRHRRRWLVLALIVGVGAWIVRSRRAGTVDLDGPWPQPTPPRPVPTPAASGTAVAGTAVAGTVDDPARDASAPIAAAETPVADIPAAKESPDPGAVPAAGDVVADDASGTGGAPADNGSAPSPVEDVPVEPAATTPGRHAMVSADPEPLPLADTAVAPVPAQPDPLPSGSALFEPDSVAAAPDADDSDITAPQPLIAPSIDGSDSGRRPSPRPRRAEERALPPGAAASLDDGSAPGPEYRIKGNADSMLFHAPSSPYYKRTRAEFWFRTADDARAAGFVEWTQKKRTTAS